MQDSSIYSQIKPQFPEQEHLKCPRCDSPNTKFCYYNNYNLSQPRHYCKSCRRYWTKGGTLRNIPVGGGSRKNTKRSSSTKKISLTTASSSSVSSTTIPVTSSVPKQEPLATIPAFDQNSKIIDMSGPFSSLLASNEPQFENLLEALNSNNGSSLQLGPNSNSGLGSGSGSPNGNHHNTDGYLGVQNGGDSNCWNGTHGWPDLAIYTPGSDFQ